MIKRMLYAGIVASMLIAQLAVVDAQPTNDYAEILDAPSEYPQELVKYAFMMDAKEQAELDYTTASKTEYDWTFEDECNEYVNQQKKQAMWRMQEERIAQEADDSYASLEEVLNGMQESVEQATVAVKNVEVVMSSAVATEPLIAGERVSEDYCGQRIEITGDNRYYLERLVMGEAGNQGFIGAALVAQTIHDTMLSDNCFDVLTIKRTHAYAGSLDIAPCDDVKRAVAYIFDNGGIAVKHKLTYFYSPANVNSKFHESRAFVVEYGDHRFFDDWG